MTRPKWDWRDLGTRFLLGGSAVALTYVLVVLLPWPSFAGLFAAFPAVMLSSLVLAGLRDGDQMAARVAHGAVAGMVGCAVCVAATRYFMESWGSWEYGLLAGIAVWLVVSTLVLRLSERLGKSKGEKINK